MRTITTEEDEETRLIAAIRTHAARLAAMPAQSPEAERCHVELRRLRAQLEALLRQWPGPRGCLTVIPYVAAPTAPAPAAEQVSGSAGSC